MYVLLGSDLLDFVLINFTWLGILKKKIFVLQRIVLFGKSIKVGLCMQS